MERCIEGRPECEPSWAEKEPVKTPRELMADYMQDYREVMAPVERALVVEGAVKPRLLSSFADMEAFLKGEFTKDNPNYYGTLHLTSHFLDFLVLSTAGAPATQEAREMNQPLTGQAKIDQNEFFNRVLMPVAAELRREVEETSTWHPVSVKSR